jgi:SAM-dependent methyltransferase
MTQSLSNAEQITFWNGEAGAKWVSAQDRLDDMLAGITARLLQSARIAAGESVLDVGCGCGDTSLQLAAAGARVVGVDISEPMLAHARQRTEQARAANLEFLRADAAEYRFEPRFDLVFSRFGVMFFADPDAAFANLRMALKPTGRLAFVCWRDWRENEWVRESTAAVRPHAPPQPQLGSEDPGPFSFADLARVRRILFGAGFDSVTAKPLDVPLAFGKTLDDAVAHMQEFGPVSRLLAEATDEQRALASAALRDALKPFATREPLTMGGAVWIVTAAAGVQRAATRG